MTRPRFLRPALLLSIGGAGAVAASALAQPAAPAETSEVRRLTPEEKERILNASDGSRTDAFLNAARGGGSSGQVHGELGFMVGTGGARSIYGSALIPLGENGAAFLAFERSEFGRVPQNRRQGRRMGPVD